MKRSSIYLKNSVDSPSAYYCIMQYIKRMENFKGNIYGLWPNSLFRLFMKPIFRHGLGNIIRKAVLFLIQCLNVLRFMIKDIVFYKPETIVICRELFPQKMPRCFSGLYKALLKNRKLIWTFDDNIKMGEISEREWKILCENADEIMVTHDYLRDTLPSNLRNIISYIPQADGDVSEIPVGNYEEKKKNNYRKEVALIWVATSANLPNIHFISKQLEEAARKLKADYNKQLTLRVVCNEKYSEKHSFLKVENIVWTRDGAAKQIAESHIGIMPLIDNEYTRGKGGFKLIQYMTAGLPVIASNVGWNKNVVGENAGVLVDDMKAKDDWIPAIIQMAKNYQVWEANSEAAKERCMEKFSFEKNLRLWEEKLGV